MNVSEPLVTSLGIVPTGHEPVGFAGGGVVRPPPDRADVAVVDVESDGGFVADGCDGVNIVVGCAADGHPPGLQQLFTDRRQSRARGGRHRLEVAGLVFAPE